MVQRGFYAQVSRLGNGELRAPYEHGAYQPRFGHVHGYVDPGMRKSRSGKRNSRKGSP